MGWRTKVTVGQGVRVSLDDYQISFELRLAAGDQSIEIFFLPESAPVALVMGSLSIEVSPGNYESVPLTVSKIPGEGQRVYLEFGPRRAKVSFDPLHEQVLPGRARRWVFA